MSTKPPLENRGSGPSSAANGLYDLGQNPQPL